ncbi:general substrate transporter [Ilyonectria destructans]|nr:general substrate transporter [Ilyonectria destructans]
MMASKPHLQLTPLSYYLILLANLITLFFPDHVCRVRSGADARAHQRCSFVVSRPQLDQALLSTHAPLLTSTAWCFDNSLTNGLQSINAFINHFNHPSWSTLGFFGASASVGGIISCFISRPLTERFGRRPMVAAGALVVGMAIMQAFSTNFHMFVAGKVLIGLGSFFQQVAAPVLVSKLAHPKQRVAISSLYNTSIFIGLIIGGWATFGTYSMKSQWALKLPCLLQAVLPAYQVVMPWFCPESPRRFLSKGRTEEARGILIKYHGNGVEDEIVLLELQEIIAGVETDKTMLKFNLEGLKSIVGTKGNRGRLWLCMWTAVGSQTIGAGFIANYLPLILDQIGMTSPKQKTLINALLNVWNWVVAFTAAFITPKVGRRTIFLVSALGVNVTFIIWTVLTALYYQTPHVGLGIGVLVMITAGSFFVCLCWIPLVIAYPIETVTTRQRSIYFSITLLTINITGFIN